MSHLIVDMQVCEPLIRRLATDSSVDGPREFHGNVQTGSVNYACYLFVHSRMIFTAACRTGARMLLDVTCLSI